MKLKMLNKPCAAYHYAGHFTVVGASSLAIAQTLKMTVMTQAHAELLLHKLHLIVVGQTK